jgi:hypothetical protein
VLPGNASHSRKSPRLPHIAYLERIAFPERALLESWLQIQTCRVSAIVGVYYNMTEILFLEMAKCYAFQQISSELSPVKLGTFILRILFCRILQISNSALRISGLHCCNPLATYPGCTMLAFKSSVVIRVKAVR